MTMGHFATALLPASRLKNAPLSFLLFCAQLPDFVWLFLALLGLETPTPHSFLDVTIIGLHAEMPYSHTGLGALAIAAAAGVLAFAVWKDAALAAWGAALSLGHWFEDLLSGWSHEVFTASSPKVGLNLYATNPYLAFAIEVAFSAAMLTLYLRWESTRGHTVSRRGKLILWAVFVGGSTFFVPTATTSFRTLLGL